MESTRTKIIHLLSSNEKTYVSGQELSDRLHISRSAIWKHMKELEKDGYLIEAIRNKGYRIVKSPNKLSENTVQWGLHTDWLGKNVVHKESTPSTQQIAHQLARDHASHGTVVIADEQTAGKGRLNREWHSAKNKGIWTSLILRPAILPYLAPQITLLTATVLADVFKKELNLDPKIKWPNDIMINDRKVAGILTEMQAEQDQIQYIIIGIGINVNQEMNELPEDIQQKATSLRATSEKEYDITSLIQRIFVHFEKVYAEYETYGFPIIKERWESYGYRLGERTTIKTMKETSEAVLVGIAEDGALLAQYDNDSIKKVYSGEIDWFPNR
ncbi:biotin--[acetyl-CoA-carboxylase] ligase [Ornithinibacillus halotolerans]|uniref:Bifunctional ligase/repressor BirA n=1 Tax=Ornithinibacillus halotolerans TaxID=1274357 RepID=A0A916W266_9BACI|nr:biotin--[acetyl-CoA-carboxylase] ligase [Ornithinibacillus halotolerans]GGA61476.1 bifunctional ligase/repressor BirA [Ornithinibacillus halotolerans]